MFKVAVATSNGIEIDEHFGQAKLFQLFEVEEDGSFRLVEERRITPHCPGDQSRGHSADETAAQLADVEAVLVNRIGPGAARTLEARGIRAFALSGPISRALSSYGKRHKLIEAGIVSQPPSGTQCGCSGGCK